MVEYGAVDHSGDGVVGNVAVDLYRGVWVGNGATDLYWGQNGRVWCCRSLLGKMLKRMTLYISTGDGVVEYGAVYL